MAVGRALCTSCGPLLDDFLLIDAASSARRRRLSVCPSPSRLVAPPTRISLHESRICSVHFPTTGRARTFMVLYHRSRGCGTSLGSEGNRRIALQGDSVLARPVGRIACASDCIGRHSTNTPRHAYQHGPFRRRVPVQGRLRKDRGHPKRCAALPVTHPEEGRCACTGDDESRQPVVGPAERARKCRCALPMSARRAFPKHRTDAPSGWAGRFTSPARWAGGSNGRKGKRAEPKRWKESPKPSSGSLFSPPKVLGKSSQEKRERVVPRIGIIY